MTRAPLVAPLVVCCLPRPPLQLTLPHVALVTYTDVRRWHCIARALVRELRELIRPPIAHYPGAIDVYDVVTEQVGICLGCAVWPTQVHVAPCREGATFHAPQRVKLSRAAQALYLPRVLKLVLEVAEEFEEGETRADYQVAIYRLEDELAEHLTSLAYLSPAAREAAADLHAEAARQRRVELRAARRSLLAVLRQRC